MEPHIARVDSNFEASVSLLRKTLSFALPSIPSLVSNPIRSLTSLCRLYESVSRARVEWNLVQPMTLRVFGGAENALISSNLSCFPSSHFLLPHSSIRMVTTRNQAALQDSTNQSQVLVKEDGKKRAKVEGECFRSPISVARADQGHNKLQWQMRLHQSRSNAFLNSTKM